MPRRKQAGYRKPRPAPVHPDRNPWSTQARDIGKLIGRRVYAEALTRLNAVLAAGNLPTVQQAEVLSFAADVAFAQGKFEQAAGIYAQAAALTQASPEGWLRPSVGQVRALLRSVQVLAAETAATQTISATLNRWQTYQQALAQAQAISAAGQPTIVPAQPTRPSVVATRLAAQFFAEGELTQARDLWQQAIQIEPKGATKARMGLGEIALREGRAADAATLATDALRVGKFQKKTLPAWRLLLRANDLLNITAIDPTLLLGLNQAKRGVRARATLILAQTLRSQNNPGWVNLADTWLTSNPGPRFAVITAELQKLLLATERRQVVSDPQRRSALAEALAQVPGLSLGETLAAIKERVRAGCRGDAIPNWQAWVDTAASQLGRKHKNRLMHAVGRAFLQEGRPNLARPVFLQIVATSADTGTGWSRAIWVLAKMEESAGNFAIAANYYRMASQHVVTPARLRGYAQVRWAKNVFSSGQHDLIVSAGPALENLLAQVDDYELALDVARQLIYSPQEVHGFAIRFKERGVTLAWAKLTTAESASIATDVLFRLARRQSDFGDYTAIISAWEGFNAQKRAWLWTNKTSFWEYLAYVARAYGFTGGLDQAQQLVTNFLSDKATPSEGKVILGVSLGLLHIVNNNLAQGLALFEKAVVEKTQQPLSGYAHYWLALKAWKQGKATEAKNHAERIRQAVGETSELGWEAHLSARAYCILANLDTRQVVNSQTRFSEQEITVQLNVINHDLSRL